MKIGLLGGTFDPIHLGHLLIAEQAREKVGLDQVWFIPTHQSPHKKDRQVTPAHHRLAMLEKAMTHRPYFHCSTIELNRSGVSYSVDTVDTLTQKYPDIEFYWIMGADMVNDLSSWYKIDQIIRSIQIIGLHRPHVKRDQLPPNIGKRLIWIEEEVGIQISSTYIRKHITHHHLLAYFLPETVLTYIEENHLYGY